MLSIDGMTSRRRQRNAVGSVVGNVVGGITKTTMASSRIIIKDRKQRAIKARRTNSNERAHFAFKVSIEDKDLTAIVSPSG
jgi:hypothetical protein